MSETPTGEWFRRGIDGMNRADEEAMRGRLCLDDKETIEELRGMVEEWVSEGFTTPPYTDAQYDIFEALGFTEPIAGYDVRRPAPQERRD